MQEPHITSTSSENFDYKIRRFVPRTLINFRVAERKLRVFRNVIGVTT